MAAESRQAVRQNIELEEVPGSFRLDAGDLRYESITVNDVSVSGAGIQLREPLQVDAPVDLTFAAGNWKVSVHGRVVWCRKHSRHPTESRSGNYRMGIEFDVADADNNVIFFLASRSMINPDA